MGGQDSGHRTGKPHQEGGKDLDSVWQEVETLNVVRLSIATRQTGTKSEVAVRLSPTSDGSSILTASDGYAFVDHRMKKVV